MSTHSHKISLGKDNCPNDLRASLEIPPELVDIISKNKDLSNHFEGLQKICRVCMLASDAEMTCIHSTINEEQLGVMYKYFSGLQVEINDGMPSKVCVSCKELIQKCYFFKLKCEHSDKTLKTFLSERISSKLKTDIDDHPSWADTTIEDLDDQSDEERSCDDYEQDLLIERPSGASLQRQKELHPAFILEGQCEICGKFCKNNRGLRRHMQTVHRDDASGKPHQCPHCDSSFACENDLNVHLSVHSKNLLCRQCKKEFATIVQLKRHIKRHMIVKPYKCEVCDKTYSEASAAEKHKRTHYGTVVEKKHLCGTCGKRYEAKSELTVHIRSHTGEKPFACVHCGRTFISSRLLNSHKRTHNDVKPYKCSTCNKSFRHSATLATHERTHTGARPYVCYRCGKCFIQSSNLTLHMRVHSGERPYSCKICNKTFKSWSTMKTHERLHTSEKLYNCKICGKKIAQQNMKDHMHGHAEMKKSFTCLLCNRSFYTEKKLNQHSLLHSGGKSFECEFCGKKLSKKCDLLKHVKKHRISEPNKISQMAIKSKLELHHIPTDASDECLQICDQANTEAIINQSVEVKEEISEIDNKESLIIAGMSNISQVSINEDDIVLIPLSGQKLFKMEIDKGEELWSDNNV